jgi:hypothetical protein
MSSKASQIFVEQVREAAALLGLGGGTLPADVAALQSAVAALQTSSAAQASDISDLQASDSQHTQDIQTLQSTVNAQSFVVARAYAWFNAAATTFAGSGVSAVATNGGAGLIRITLQSAFDDTNFVVVVGGHGDTVKETARTVTTIDLDIGAATEASVAVFGGALAA